MEHTAHRSRSGHKPEREGFFSFLKGSVIGLGISLLMGIPVLVLATWICSALPDPLTYSRGIGIGLTLFLSFLAGILAVRRNGGGILPSGACVGGLWVLLLFLLGLILGKESDASAAPMILWRLLAIGLSLFGSFIGCKRSPPRTKRNHGHKRR